MTKEKDAKASQGDELTDGVLLVIGPGVYFIPRDDLVSFKAPASVASQARAELKQRPELARGHPNDPLLLGVKLSHTGPVLEFSSIYEHGLTFSRYC